jgi:hypothetical protein
MKPYNLFAIFILAAAFLFIAGLSYAQDDDSTRNILKQGLLGAGTGAIAAGASGGDAGKGALIGAGTNVIGSALLDAMTTPSSSGTARRRRAAPPPEEEEYYDDEYGDEEYYYEEPPPQESGTQKVLKQGLLGAGTGAIAAGASGGDAGKGALIGAGTNVIGSALLDTVTQPPQQPRRVYRRAPRRQTTQPQVSRQTTSQTQSQVQEETTPDGSRKKVIKKYDDTGKLVSEEEIYY